MPISKDNLLDTTVPAKLIFTADGEEIGEGIFDGTEDVRIELDLPEATITGGGGGTGGTDPQTETNTDAIAANTTAISALGNEPFADRDAVEAATIGDVNNRITILSDITPTEWEKVDSQPIHLIKIQSLDGAWWQPAGTIWNSYHGLVAKNDVVNDAEWMSRVSEAAFANDRYFSLLHDEDVFCDIDLDDLAFAKDGTEDIDFYNSEVVAAARTTTDPTIYDDGAGGGYKPDVERANGLIKAVNWYRACPKAGIGEFELRGANKLFKIFGQLKVEDYNSHYAMKGRNVLNAIILSLNYAAHPTKGVDWSECTIVLDKSIIGSGVTPTVGYGFGIEDVQSTGNPEDDDIARANGAWLIKTISTTTVTSDTITFDIRNQAGVAMINGPGVQAPSNGNLGTQASQITIPGFQLAVTGGFNDRNDESMFSNNFGSNVKESNMVWADHSDPDQIRYFNSDHERKAKYSGFQGEYQGIGNIYIAFEGRIIRTAKQGGVTLVGCQIGGYSSFDVEAERGADAQIAADMTLERSVIGSVTDFGVLTSGFSRITAQVCIIANVENAARAISGGKLDLSSTLLTHCGIGAYAGEGAEILMNSGTTIVNCDEAVHLEENAKLLGSTLPTIIACPIGITGRQSMTIIDNTVPTATSLVNLINIPKGGWSAIEVDIPFMQTTSDNRNVLMEVEIGDEWVLADYEWRLSDPLSTSTAVSSLAGTADTTATVLRGTSNTGHSSVRIRFPNPEDDSLVKPFDIVGGIAKPDTPNFRTVVGGGSVKAAVAGRITGMRFKPSSGTFVAGMKYKLKGLN